MAKSDPMKVVAAKLPREVIAELEVFAEAVAASRSSLVLEAIEAYLPLLRAGRRVLRESRLPEAEKPAGPPKRQAG